MCDETTWGNGGFGESGTGMVSWILGKPGVTKCGKIVILCDVHHVRLRSYLHHHNIHKNPSGCPSMGNVR